jgi:hypothetical protein
MNKMFKSLFAALAIVLVALSVSACGIDDIHDEGGVDITITNPSGKKLHVEYEVSIYERTIYDEDADEVDKHLYRTMDNSEIAWVYVFGEGLDNKNYYFRKEIKGQSTGSVDLELDEKTYGVRVTVRAVLKEETPGGHTVFTAHEDYWFQEQL